jgi:Skp family chaperone for outer membrane proteins
MVTFHCFKDKGMIVLLLLLPNFVSAQSPVSDDVAKGFATGFWIIAFAFIGFVFFLFTSKANKGSQGKIAKLKEEYEEKIKKLIESHKAELEKIKAESKKKDDNIKALGDAKKQLEAKLRTAQVAVA